MTVSARFSVTPEEDPSGMERLGIETLWRSSCGPGSRGSQNVNKTSTCVCFEARALGDRGVKCQQGALPGP